MKYVASCSCGKDSLAMVLMLIEKKYQLDEVIFFDTGWEFQSIYRVWEKLCQILDEHAIQHNKLTPDKDFDYMAFEHPHKNRLGVTTNGYGWCGSYGCRWGTTIKAKTIKKYLEVKYTEPVISYIGIAADEQRRLLKNRDENKCYPLVHWGVSEADCLQYCYSHGFDWKEPSCDNVDLYAILDRVSCYCCGNKNLKELRAMYKYLPFYWHKLIEFQARTDRAFKSESAGYKLKNNLKPACTIFEIEEMFKLEEQESEE